MNTRIRTTITRALAAAAATALLFTVSACGEQGNMEKTASLAEVQANADKMVKDAAGAVFPSGFDLTDQGPQPLQCNDSTDRPTGKVLTSVNYWVDGIDTAANTTYFDKLKTWFAANGWHVETDKRPHDLFLNASRDDYLMSLEASSAGRLNIGASTPCVWRDGTPPTSH
ncbi:hypothetical protein [Amycolatopsis sp. Hca4]|uniref:hypothetical protein n=1 Tax=Amycolatopsis sp. Hca4 TaxID=2742131 RepID=UPI0020CB2E92|nr:hypothetical protein [Amycolatopsis sp. Hca4]